MNPLYLSEVILTDFRTYGPESSVKINPGAGLTILCGMNGLGKTGFFDGVEWALTGDVRRLSARIGEKYLPTVLGRNRSDKYSVRLRFSDGTELRRNQAIPELPAKVIALLKSESWRPPLVNIAPYLRLTHFLAQSGQQRFVDVGGDRQWELLRGAAGADRIERVRYLLDAKRVRNAFRREIEKRENDQRELETKQNRAKVLQMRAIELRQLASANAALSPADCRSAAEALLAELRPHQFDLFLKVDEQPLLEFLTEFGRVLEKWQSDLQGDIDQIPVAAEMAVRWSEHMRNQPVQSENKRLAQENLEKREAAEKDARGKADQAKTALTQLERSVVDLEARGAAVRLALETKQRTASAQSEIEKIDRDLSTAKQKLTDSEKELTTAQQLQTRRHGLVLQENTLQKSEAALDEVVALLDILAAQKKAADEATVEKNRILQISEQSTKTAGELRVKIVAAKNIIEPLEREMHLAQRTAGVIAKAVAEIAANLRATDEVCPVCAQKHPQGHLLKAAQGSMESFQAGSAETARQLATERDNLRSLEALLQSLIPTDPGVISGVAPLDAVIQQYNSTRVRVHSHEALAGLLPSELATYPSRRREESRQVREKLAREAAQEPPVEQVENRRALAEAAIRENKAKVQEMEARQGELHRTIETLEAYLTSNADLLANLPDALPLGDEAHRKLSGLLEEAKKKTAAAKAELDPLLRELELAQNETVKARLEITRLEAIVGQAEAQRLELSARWKALGFKDEPGETAVGQRRQILLEKSSLAKRGREQLLVLAQGMTLWDSNEELGRIEMELKEITAYALGRGLVSIDSLSAAIAEAGSATTRASQAFQHARELATELTEQAEKFSAAALAPLNGRIGRFNSVISPFDFKYEVTAKVRPTVTDIQHVLQVQGLEGEPDKGVNPIAHLSEGQTSALGLSVLFAAATEYPWSRWPALLMDDPLQNTDLIHASAFVDVIRGMILDRGFQVIISTHDMDEAEFIGRKCLRGGVAVSRTELVGPGPNGVRLRDRPMSA